VARFKLDENLPAAAEALLRDAGHDVATVIQEELSGASDLDVHAAARAERRTVVTLDRGFGDPRRHPTAGTPGVVVLRPPSQDATSILSLLQVLVPLFEEHELDGALWVVEPHRVRIRRS
jgi:predicted nuclease of predicted toxin-antitoxin system